MDELRIEDKTYISSKRAAKVTGYAKDYVGQLCREGRVPARLVGRSWYVLESAIRDHRFGKQEPEEKSPDVEKFLTPGYQETIQYESYRADEFPSKEEFLEDGATEPELVAEKEVENKIPATEAQNTVWREWFEHIDQSVAEVSSRGEDMEMKEEDREEEVTVPIRAIHSAPLKPSLEQERTSVKVDGIQVPMKGKQESAPQDLAGDSSVQLPYRFPGVLQVSSIAVAVFFAASAVFASGIFDINGVSSIRATVITGVSEYNK